MVEIQKKAHWLYFAFGSNMNPSQIRARCVNPEVIGPAKLINHKCSFYGYSKVWDGALETVEPAVGQDVWGVIYKLTRSDWDRLDAWQDVRLDGSGAYFHFPATVIDAQGVPTPVLLYKKDMQGTSQLPSKQYVEMIAQGAQSHGLPVESIAGWKSVPTKNASYEVPRRGNFDRALLVEMACTECGG